MFVLTFNNIEPGLGSYSALCNEQSHRTESDESSHHYGKYNGSHSPAGASD